MKLNTLVYLAYYFREMDWNKFNRFFDHVRTKSNISSLRLWRDILSSVFLYNIAPLDYFYFRFYDLEEKDRSTYAGTGFMYEYQLKMNPKSSRHILENKLLFLKEYQKFVKHRHLDLKRSDVDSVSNFIKEANLNKIVLKSSDGQCGDGVEIFEINVNQQLILDNIRKSKNDLLEEFIEQHDALMQLSPSGLNTVRIFTQLNEEDKVDILGCRLRITINSSVDNLAAGNIAAPIDEATGKVYGHGVYSDITKQEETAHPVTGVQIVGFQVPFWHESIQMVKDAAGLHKQNRSIGWDIAITNNGPELLEGNHNWCKLLWQLPVKKGLKHQLEKYTI